MVYMLLHVWFIMVLRCEIPGPNVAIECSLSLKWKNNGRHHVLPLKGVDISDGWNTFVLVTLKMVLPSKIPSRAMYESVRRSRFVPMRLAEVPLESL